MADFIKIGDNIAYRKSAVTRLKLIQSKNDVNCLNKTRYSIMIEHVSGANQTCSYIGISDNTDADQVFQYILDELNR